MAVSKRMTKAQIITELAEKTGLTKKQVQSVFEALREMMKRELGKRGPGEFSIPDLVKVVVKKTKARKAGEKMNPFTGEPLPAKPASKRLTARPLKKLKDVVA
ncbi:MAG: hypothetical protein GX614_07335 [Sandaracinaceae bacterium]|nr:hypothetical protein [Sandaracinaceae bacterium]